MGFGTLLIGYFLLLNVTNYALTDLIASLIMALGLAKLSSVNKHFSSALFASMALAAVGLIELVLTITQLFAPQIDISLSFLPILRSAVICMTTVLILLGIRDVAAEVDLPSLAARAKRMIPVSAVIYIATIILDTPILFKNVEPIIAAAAFAIVLIATLFLIIFNLVTMYSAYMRICMPNQTEKTKKHSRLEFFNKLKEQQELRTKEYNEYVSEKIKNKDNKK